MTPARHDRVPLRRPPADAANTWGPYYDTLYPPGYTIMIIAWKVVPKRMESAKELWQERERLRRAYEEIHGSDPALWPNQHPGVVVFGLAACLACHWIFGEHDYYRYDRVFQYAEDIARRHETSGGTFRGGGDDRLKPTARWVPDPPPVQTAPIPRRVPIVPVRIAERYAGGIGRTRKT